MTTSLPAFPATTTTLPFLSLSLPSSQLLHPSFLTTVPTGKQHQGFYLYEIIKPTNLLKSTPRTSETMAPPAAATADLPLPQRLMALAQTLQFGWFIGFVYFYSPFSSRSTTNEDGGKNRHLTLLLTTIRYAIATAKFSTNTTVASIAYRVGFLSAAVTYGIVVYKAYRSKIRAGQVPTGQQGVVKALSDENVQYLCKSFHVPF